MPPVAKHPFYDDCKRFVELFADTSRDMRTESGLTKSQVAADGGVSPQTVGYVENRERIPRLDVIVKMAREPGG